MKRMVYLLAFSLLAVAGCTQQTTGDQSAANAQVAQPVASGPTKTNKTSFRIAWSRYTGWEPWALAEKNGILKKWADKYGIKIELVYVDNYVGSIESYSKGEFDGCTMTNVDALTLPAASGTDSTALIIGDYSNGNDGVAVKNAQSITALKGRNVSLVQASVSQYLLERALQINGMSTGEMKLVDTPEANIAPRFVADGSGAAVTWNPHLGVAAAAPGAKIVFDSSDIQGEILDLMVIRSDSPESLRNALVGAWYETMALLASGDANQRRAAVEFMANNSGVSPAEFEKQLQTTAMFYLPWDGTSFANSPSLEDTMDRAREFGFRNGLLGKNAKTEDAIGIELGNGKIIGDPGNVKLRFTADYMQRASLGTLK